MIRIIYLAEFKKIAPAGNSKPHSLKSLKSSKYGKEPQLLLSMVTLFLVPD